MASEDTSDLVMIFLNENGMPITGESSTLFNSVALLDDPWLEGYSIGYCFGVKNFRFNAGNVDTSAATDPLAGLDPSKITDPKTKKAFEKLKAKKTSVGRQLDGRIYPGDIKPISFTKMMDTASVSLFDYCANIKMFQSASLIKRKAAGTEESGITFLRMDFGRVLVTGIDWSEDHVVTETVTFICRSVTINYRQQQDPGSMQYLRSAGFWSLVASDQPQYYY
jgi:type VI protein secretion system component Hcp